MNKIIYNSSPRLFIYFRMVALFFVSAFIYDLNVSAADIQMKGVYLSNHEKWFSLASEREKRWVTIGSVFGSYTIIEYSESERVLKLVRGEDERLIQINEPSSEGLRAVLSSASANRFELRKDTLRAVGSTGRQKEVSKCRDREDTLVGENLSKVTVRQINSTEKKELTSLTVGESSTLLLDKIQEPDEYTISDEDHQRKQFSRKPMVINKQPRPDQYVIVEYE
jgi:hypothetical protein